MALNDNLVIIGLLDVAETIIETLICPKHVNKKIELYCELCKKSCCSSCFLSEHKSHEVIDFQETLLRERQKLVAASDIFQQGMNSLIRSEYRAVYLSEKNAADDIKLINDEAEAIVKLVREKQNATIAEIRTHMALIVDSKALKEIKLSELLAVTEQLKTHQCPNMFAIFQAHIANLTEVLKYEQELYRSQNYNENIRVEIGSSAIHQTLNGMFKIKTNLKRKAVQLSSSSSRSASEFTEHSAAANLTSIAAVVAVLQDEKMESPTRVPGPLLQSISRLCALNNIPNISEFVAAPGAVKSLLDMIVVNIDSADIVQEGIKAITNLCVGNTENKSKLGADGACELVVICLKSYRTTHPNIALHGVRAVTSLSISDDNRETLGAVGACEAVVACLTTTEANISTMEEVLKAVANLAANSDDNRKRLGAAGACQVVSHLMNTLLDKTVVNQNIAMYSAWAIQNLLDNGVNTAALNSLNMKATLQNRIIDNDRVTDADVRDRARLVAGVLS